MDKASDFGSEENNSIELFSKAGMKKVKQGYL